MPASSPSFICLRFGGPLTATDLLTSADYFAVKYQSPLLGMLVALVGVVFLVPYITLQLTGIQILLNCRLRRNRFGASGRAGFWVDRRLRLGLRTPRSGLGESD